MGRNERANQLSKKLMDLISEIKNEGFEVWVCEIDDGSSISIPTNVIYDSSDDRIYIEANYQ